MNRLVLKTLPKSASIYILEVLERNYGLKRIFATSGCFPSDTLNFDILRNSKNINFVSQEHIACTPNNLQLIKEFKIKLVLHVRDPRDALISWIYHCLRLVQNKQADELWRSCPLMSEKDWERPIGEIIDWHIQNYLPVQMEWLSEWNKMLDPSMNSIMASHYLDFSENIEIYFDRIAKFIGLPRIRSLVLPKKENGVHFRRGISDEWQTAFSETQKRDSSHVLSKYPELLWVLNEARDVRSGLLNDRE